FPQLVISAAVAAGNAAPYKARAYACSFDGERAIFHYGTKDPHQARAIATSDLERDYWDGGASLTLPSLMAVSGAALSPLMGRFTLPAFRFLLAVLNVRLGV